MPADKRKLSPAMLSQQASAGVRLSQLLTDSAAITLFLSSDRMKFLFIFPLFHYHTYIFRFLRTTHYAYSSFVHNRSGIIILRG
jgi:hypothetical protein